MKKIVVLLFVISSIYVSGNEFPKSEVTALLEKDNRDAFVYVGTSTLEQLKCRRSGASDCTIRFNIGDSPNGDGKATMISLIDCPTFPLLGLRLKMDMSTRKYHILGFWTAQKLSNQSHQQASKLAAALKRYKE